MYKLLCLLVGYLFISSTLMGFFVLEKENQNINSLSNIDYRGNLIKMDGSIPLDMFIDTVYSTNNLRFVNLTGYAGNALEITPVFSAIGSFSEYKNTVYLRGLEPDANGYYNVGYHIVNQNNGDFALIPAMTNAGTLPRAIKANFRDMDNNPKLVITYDYDEPIFDAITNAIYTGYIGNYWHNSGENVIYTEFNTNNGQLTIIMNDNVICQIPVSVTDTFTIYGGLRLLEPNTVYITEIESEVYLTNDDSNNTNLLKIIAQILTWNVDEQYLPMILNIMFIKFPMLCLGIALGLIIFGVS